VNEVKAGQEYADQDPRVAGRTIRIDRIHDLLGRSIAVCTIVTDAEKAVTSRVGQRTSISVGRFTPANYKLIREAP
jgi:hypothetical protein